MLHQLKIPTRGKQEVIDLTRQVTGIIHREGFTSGLCHVFCAHTTAGITTADLDPGADLDMLDAFRGMIPEGIQYRHPHNPEHMPDHILATMIGASAMVPVKGGQLQLGTWQCIVLFEFDGPRTRDVMVTLIPG